jgi:hypothetical protein
VPVGEAPTQRGPGGDPGERHPDHRRRRLQGQPDVGRDQAGGQGLDDEHGGAADEHDDPGECGAHAHILARATNGTLVA